MVPLLFMNGRDAYTLVQAEIEQYFMDIREDFEKACYGCYFMEVAEYYTRENLDGGPMLNLLYVTLRALQDARLDYELVRCIFEMKAMVQNGEYPYETAEDSSLSEAVRCAIAYVLTAPLQKLYGLTLTPEAFREFSPGTEPFQPLSGSEFQIPGYFKNNG
ncbi:MAG: DNA repair protein RecO C-terminal domain-containing protein [Lachnospiraceae bacterium]